MWRPVSVRAITRRQRTKLRAGRVELWQFCEADTARQMALRPNYQLRRISLTRSIRLPGESPQARCCMVSCCQNFYREHPRPDLHLRGLWGPPRRSVGNLWRGYSRITAPSATRSVRRQPRPLSRDTLGEGAKGVLQLPLVSFRLVPESHSFVAALGAISLFFPTARWRLQCCQHACKRS